ncbi:MAG: family 43 glycosylhydrolase, partial [Pirellulaceae bacterium]|nr:family 43 glycosylhydrolase [Pirellulaceae bacterium]
SYYYLMVSWDFCCAGDKSTYKVVVGRSKKPLGPFIDKRGFVMEEGGGTVLLASDARWRGPGHNSLLQTRQGDYLVYHVYDAEDVRKGRILQVRPVSWSRDDWPHVKDPLLDPQASQRNRKQLSPLVGNWDHLVNGRDRYDIFFEAAGEVSGTAGESYWKQEGRQLLLRWVDPRAPGGAWIDHVQLSADGKSYSGKNQNGTTIEGHKRVD